MAVGKIVRMKDMWSFVLFCAVVAVAAASNSEDTDDGEEQRIHDVVFHGLTGDQAHPHVVFLGGGSCSGKGAIAENYSYYHVHVPDEHAYVNSDDVMMNMSAWQSLAEDTMCAADILHESAHELAGRFFAEAIEGRYHLVWDGTFSNATDSLIKIELARKYGYNITIAGAARSAVKAARGSVVRAAEELRWVSLPTICSTHAGFASAALSYEPYVDRLLILDLNAGMKNPRPMYDSGVVYNDTLFDMFLAQATETERDVMAQLDTDTLEAYATFEATCCTDDADDNNGSVTQDLSVWWYVKTLVSTVLCVLIVLFLVRATYWRRRQGYKAVKTGEDDAPMYSDAQEGKA